MKLEEKLAKLEKIANQLESDIPLEKALQLFEESVKLANECMETLNDCKGKLTVIQENLRGTFDEE
ncbi:MAG: exodeoxyribonuclease VII small subunit [Clostridia bacterium]|nr:exodeoxyribonuclease VII small subunit [Clostridia bacterium]